MRTTNDDTSYDSSGAAMLTRARKNLGIGLELSEWIKHHYDHFIIVQEFDVTGEFDIDGCVSNGADNRSYWGAVYEAGAGRKLVIAKNKVPLSLNKGTSGTSGTSGSSDTREEDLYPKDGCGIRNVPYTMDYIEEPIEDQRIVRLMNYRDKLIDDANEANNKVKWVEGLIDSYKEEFKEGKHTNKLNIVSIGDNKYTFHYTFGDFRTYTTTYPSHTFWLFDADNVCIDMVSPHGGIRG